MTIDVFADLFLSNGEEPKMSAIMRSENVEIKFSSGSVKYNIKLEIINGLIISHFTPIFENHDFWDHWDNIFELTKITIDPIVLTRALHLGQGLLYNIRYGRAENGSIIARNPDTANEPKFDLTSNEQAEPVVRLIANNFRLKFALRDFNMGLLDRKDCAFHFYREIETLARVIGGENKDDKPEWDIFYEKIGASDDEKDQIKDNKKIGTIRYSADKLRHGNAPGSRSPQEWEYMKKTAKSLLLKSIQYLIKKDQSALS
jgi:hypothetical protein